MNDRTSWFYNPIRWKVGWIKERPQEIKWFWQRGRRGYADCDVWGIDSYLSSWMPEAVKKIRENSISYPAYGEASTPEGWNKILIKIEKGFIAHREEMEADYMYANNGKFLPPSKWKPKRDKLYKEHKEGMKLFAKWYGHLWD